MNFMDGRMNIRERGSQKIQGVDDNWMIFKFLYIMFLFFHLRFYFKIKNYRVVTVSNFNFFN